MPLSSRKMPVPIRMRFMLNSPFIQTPATNPVFSYTGDRPLKLVNCYIHNNGRIDIAKYSNT